MWNSLLRKKAIVYFKRDELPGVEEYVVQKENLIGEDFPGEFDCKRKNGQYEVGVTLKAA